MVWALEEGYGDFFVGWQALFFVGDVDIAIGLGEDVHQAGLAQQGFDRQSGFTVDQLGWDKIVASGLGSYVDGQAAFFLPSFVLAQQRRTNDMKNHQG